MLGLRRYHNVQIDIWQGDIAKFFVDFCSLETSLQWPERFSGSLSALENSKKSHVSFEVKTELYANSAMTNAKKLLESPDGQRLRRITFVTHSPEIYDILQEALFNTFEDI